MRFRGAVGSLPSAAFALHSGRAGVVMRASWGRNRGGCAPARGVR